MKVIINISARHVHLNKEVYDKLFDSDLTIKQELLQPNTFAANETVTIKTDKYTFNNVRIVGPLRDYNQVEISASDARLLGLNPPVRTSGDLAGAEEITMETSKASVVLPCTIIADRHLHMSKDFAELHHINNGDILKLDIPGIKHGVIDVHAKITSDGVLEAHLDTDDANAFLINKTAEGEINIS